MNFNGGQRAWELLYQSSLDPRLDGALYSPASFVITLHSQLSCKITLSKRLLVNVMGLYLMWVITLKSSHHFWAVAAWIAHRVEEPALSLTVARCRLEAVWRRMRLLQPHSSSCDFSFKTSERREGRKIGTRNQGICTRTEMVERTKETRAEGLEANAFFCSFLPFPSGLMTRLYFSKCFC